VTFQLADGGVALRSDFPCEAGYSGDKSWRRAQVPAAAGEALCLVTHSHRDHFLPALGERYGQELLGPADVTSATPHAGLERHSYLYHQAKGESVLGILGRGLPRQGHGLGFRKE
jgi:hypothetical protein